MSDKDALSSRGRAAEEEYFRKKELELIEKMKRRARLAAERQQMADASGVADEAILDTLLELGYNRDTVMLLHLVPLIHVAWIDGDVTGPERDRIIDAACAHGVQDGSPAYRQLTDWLSRRPPREFFERTLQVIRDVLDTLPPDQRQASTRDLVTLAARVASVSGEFLGLGKKLSEAELALLEHVAQELERGHEQAAQTVLSDIR